MNKTLSIFLTLILSTTILSPSIQCTSEIEQTTSRDLVTPVETYPTTIRVPDDYPTIQDAINAASPGDIIQVAAGVYYERLTVNKSLALVGESRETTIIDGNRTGTVIYVSSSDVTIQGFTIQYGKSYPGNTAFVNSSHNILIKDNKIMGSHHGIDLTNSNNVSIVGNDMVDNDFVGIFVSYCRNCSIHENRMMGYDHGIRLHRSESTTVSMNTFSANGYHPFSAIDVWYSQYNYVLKNSIVTRHNNGISLLFSNFTVVEENKVADCYGTGMMLEFSHNNTIYHNNFLDNNRQIFITRYSNSNVFDSGAEGNYWSDYNGTDLYFGPYQNITGSDGIGDTPYVIDGNNQDNYPLIHPYGSIHNLDTNLTYLTIQSAIDAPETLDGHTIFVEEGTYCENLVVNKTVSLIGENRNTTIIDGNLIGYVVWVKANKVTIKGFTMRRSGTYKSVSLGVFLDHSNNSKIDGNIITTNGDGILLIYACNNFINGNIITENGRGIRLHHYCNNNSLYGNTMTDNYEGIHLFGNSNSNLVIKNMIEGRGKQHSYEGIKISDYCRYNIISGNTITNNEEGIELLFSCEHNVFTGNKITENIRGIRVHVSNCNNIYHNNFINHTIQVSTYRSFNNTWDNGYPSGGNYWSSHNPPDLYSGPYQNETGSDGIGDIPYILEENNTDRYPLIYPYGYVPSPDLNNDEIVDIFDVVIVAEAFGSKPGDPNWNPITDLVQDELIDIFDVVLLANNFGKTT